MNSILPSADQTCLSLDRQIHQEFYFNLEQAVSSNKANSVPRSDDILIKMMQTTCCVIILKNGLKAVAFTVCPETETFDQLRGENIAKEKALKQLELLTELAGRPEGIQQLFSDNIINFPHILT